MNILTSPHWKYYYLAIITLGAIWIAISTTAPRTTTEGVIPAPQVGFLAPDFRLSNTGGEEMSLSELKGQPVLINIWASWCPPCRAEMPALENVYREYGQDGLLVLAVNATNQDDVTQALSFAQSLGLSFPILLDTNGEVSRKYQVQALPSTFFVDSQGIIQEIVIGGPISEALLKIRVEQLLDTGETDGQ